MNAYVPPPSQYEENKAPKARGESNVGRVGWPIAISLIVAGSLVTAIADGAEVLNGFENGSQVRGLGAIIALASAIPLRHLGRKLFGYVPLSYVAWIFLSLAMTGIATNIVQETVAKTQCNGVSAYADDMRQTGLAFNDRTSILKNPTSLTYGNLQVLIDATNNDITDLQAYPVPPALVSLNNQRIIVMKGWVQVFQALQHGTYSDQMLFDLQPKDDRVEQLTREVNATCAAAF